MAARRGTATPSKIYRGTIPVKRVMRGTVEVWSASSYPMTVAWGPVYLALAKVVLGTHTIEESGTFTITNTSTAAAGHFIEIVGPWGTTASGYVTSPTATTTQTLTVGDEITFQGASPGATASGTWSIVKN